MHFLTGIAVTQEPGSVYVAAITWHKHIPPRFVTRGLTLEYIKTHLLATVIVRSHGLRATVNAACNRTVERLLIDRLIIPGQHPQIQLLVKPYLSREHFMLPSEKTKNHWLLRAAETTMTAWERGER